MWRSAVRHTRCLVPALGWYEWRATPEGKVPYFIHAPGLAGLCFAGLWSEWKNPAGEAAAEFRDPDPGRLPDALAAVHDRMPVVAAGGGLGRVAVRLAGAITPRGWRDQVANSLEEFEYYPVSRYVNAPRNQGERCIERGHS